jgi:hypothetical protein
MLILLAILAAEMVLAILLLGMLVIALVVKKKYRHHPAGICEPHPGRLTGSDRTHALRRSCLQART